MKNILLLVVGAVLGGIASFILTSGLVLGVGAGAGIATGLKAGACLAVEAAREEGFITAEQVDDVFAGISEQLDSKGIPNVEKPNGSDAECRDVVAQMKSTAG